MAMELVQTEPDLLTFRIQRVLSEPEFAKAQRVAAELLQGKGPMRVLVDARTFAGFASTGDWGNMSQQLSDSLIVKVAIVADPAWKNLMWMFSGKGIRKFPIEFFGSEDWPKALAWLAEPPAEPSS